GEQGAVVRGLLLLLLLLLVQREGRRCRRRASKRSALCRRIWRGMHSFPLFRAPAPPFSLERAVRRVQRRARAGRGGRGSERAVTLVVEDAACAGRGGELLAGQRGCGGRGDGQRRVVRVRGRRRRRGRGRRGRRSRR